MNEDDFGWILKDKDNPYHQWSNFIVFRDAPHKNNASYQRQVIVDFYKNFKAPFAHVVTWDKEVMDSDLTIDHGYSINQNAVLTREVGSKTFKDSHKDIQIFFDKKIHHKCYENQIHHESGFLISENLTAAKTGQLNRLQEVIQGGLGIWVRAEIRGEHAGELGLFRTPWGSRFQCIKTASKFRRLGVATKMIQSACEYASTQWQTSKFILVTQNDNEAKKLYLKLGFSNVEKNFFMTKLILE